MLLSPLENTATFNLNWTQVRPRVTQEFGKDFYVNGKLAYQSMGLKGHNGIDFGCGTGTPVYAPCDGVIRVADQGSGGYGLHIKLRSHHGAREIVLGHLSKVVVSSHSSVNMGDLIGYSGNTGFSTASHLHMGLRFLLPNSSQDVFTWAVRDYGNGYYGYVDPIKSIITFKGTLKTTSIQDK